MWSRSLSALLLAALAGCPGGDGAIGDSCTSHSDCTSALQCITGTCVPRCQRAPECGDGYACDIDGYCHLASGQAGDKCSSEVQCAPGLSCQIDGTATDDTGHLLASCTAQNAAGPAGSSCDKDSACRNGTCALGRCVDLCKDTRDCGSGLACMGIPRVESDGAMFEGCLPPRGAVVWRIPVTSPTSETILIPIPDAARSATVVFQVDDLAQRVGARSISSPAGAPLYTKPCEAGASPPCTDPIAADQYFAQPLRHLPDYGQSVLLLPTSPSVPLEAGAYRVAVSSFRANGGPGSAIPRVTAVVRMDAAPYLDLHFHFLELDDHPCEQAFGGVRLDASAASKPTSFFQADFLGGLRTVFAGAGIAIGNTTFEDITDHPDLDGLAVEDVGSLLSLGAHDSGIDVFFVRTLSPVGLQAFGPNPGPAGIAGTRQSGIVIGVDTLCYRSWTQLARLTGHEIARYMGLYHNVELEVGAHPSWRDPVGDSDDSSNNLMFFSEFGGIELSAGQREILSRSAVLR
jgi:hypothetical protein